MANPVFIEKEIELGDQEGLGSAAEDALGRSAIYGFLGEVYCAPLSERILRPSGWEDLLEALSAFAAALPFVDELRHQVEHLDGRELQERLAVEHTRLLVGPGAGYVPPYESVFRDKRTIDYCGCADAGLPPATKTVDGLLWGDSTVGVEESYHEAGFALAEAWRGTPDHLGLELQFMGELCRREAEARQSGDLRSATIWRDGEKAFLSEHLALWIPRFTAKAAEAARHPFYKAIAVITAEVVHDDLEALGRHPSGLDESGEVSE